VRVLINGPQIAKQTRRPYSVQMQHMRNSAIILVALSAAMLTLAAAEARSEEQIEGNDNDPD